MAGNGDLVAGLLGVVLGWDYVKVALLVDSRQGRNLQTSLLATLHPRRNPVRRLNVVFHIQ
jgi:hypothetical protein